MIPAVEIPREESRKAFSLSRGSCKRGGTAPVPTAYPFNSNPISFSSSAIAVSGLFTYV